VDERLAFLASLPGIGLEKAQALLDHCGTPAWALDFLTGGAGASTDGAYVDDVPGIGPVTRQRVRALLGLDEGVGLAVADTEATTPAGTADVGEEAA
jgi:hypothetical protein